MAKSLFLTDGSAKLIFNEDDRQRILAELIREYLGQDCEELFCSLLEEGKGGYDHPSTNAGDDYELIADGYLAMLRDVLDELDGILLFFNAARLDRRRVYQALQKCRDNLYNNL